jgi:hypothetical protein
MTMPPSDNYSNKGSTPTIDTSLMASMHSSSTSTTLVTTCPESKSAQDCDDTHGAAGPPCCDCRSPGRLRHHPYGPMTLSWCDKCFNELLRMGADAFFTDMDNKTSHLTEADMAVLRWVEED